MRAQPILLTLASILTMFALTISPGAMAFETIAEVKMTIGVELVVSERITRGNSAVVISTALRKLHRSTESLRALSGATIVLEDYFSPDDSGSPMAFTIDAFAQDDEMQAYIASRAAAYSATQDFANVSAAIVAAGGPKLLCSEYAATPAECSSRARMLRASPSITAFRGLQGVIIGSRFGAANSRFMRVDVRADQTLIDSFLLSQVPIAESLNKVAQVADFVKLNHGVSLTCDDSKISIQQCAAGAETVGRLSATALATLRGKVVVITNRFDENTKRVLVDHAMSAGQLTEALKVNDSEVQPGRRQAARSALGTANS